MADATGINATEITRLTGSQADGTETNPVGSSANGELWIRDTLDNGGLDAVLNLPFNTPIEIKAGGSRKTLRKYVIIEALTTGIKWGFSNSTQSFDIFKSQLIMVPVGENTQIWAKSISGTGELAVGEIS